MDTKKQIIIYLGFSIFCGIASNGIESSPIPWINQPIELVSNKEDLISLFVDPQIRN